MALPPKSETPGIVTILGEAVDIESPAQRAAYLDRACSDDSELRQQLEKLIADHFRAGDFLESPLQLSTAAMESAVAEVADFTGQTIGRYKLLERIGVGGMGVVYMAEQTEPVRRKVALKVIKPGMDTQQVVVRFAAERQALALMDHPNIARVLDGGTTDSGHPYFVMELVRGMPITEYCDRKQLSVRQRLELFVSVCRAVQHAHQKGIIHRDLKPSNILVMLHDGTPVPKVIDFGVAKALSGQLTEQTFFTQFAQMVGTPLYMSPEQAGESGLDADTRADIYSLGVLLYELLTGTTPFEQRKVREVGYDEMRRMIREDEPPRPSSRLSTLGNQLTTISQRRGTDARHLGQIVRGELEWIVMKALEKDRTRRYETINGFALDVQRYLNDEPVAACPPSKVYRLRKFARRNKTALGTSALVVFALLLGTAVSSWQAMRATKAEGLAEMRLEAERDVRLQAEAARNDAKREAAKAAAVTRFLIEDLFESAAPDKALGRQVTVEEMLSAAAAKIDQAFPDQPELEAEIRRVIGNIYRQLGQYTEAEPLLTTALEIQRRTLGDKHPRTLESGNELGLLYYYQGKHAEAVSLFVEALDIRRRTQGEEHPHTLFSLNNLAEVYWGQGNFAEAESLFVEALEIRRRTLGEDHPNTLQSLASLAAVYRDQERPAEAEPLLRDCLNRYERLRPDDWQRFRVAAVLGGVLLDQGKLAEAETPLLEGYEGMRAREATIPARARIHLTKVVCDLVNLYELWDRLDQAADWQARFAGLAVPCCSECREPASPPSAKP